MVFIYDVIYLIAFIFYLPVLIAKGKLHAGFRERFGFLSQDTRHKLSQKPNIWFHAVSVGEVLAIVGLVERIRTKNPQRQIVISTVTVTGHKIARERFKKEDIVIFAPLDLSFSVARFIAAIQPEIFVTVETELWPNLLTSLGRRDVPMAMANGRISDKSFYRYRRFFFISRPILRPFRVFCMQGDRDADRIIALGALPRNVMVAGSMKFDDVTSGPSIEPSRLGFKEDALIWVAGSTHPGEEKIILDVFNKLKKNFPALSLVLAPRHIERSPEVCDLVRSEGLTPLRYSQVSAQPPNDQAVIVLDTMGDLKSFYRLATVVFVGKSLVGYGGQNIIEPAFFGKPVIIGPNMQNFQDITEIFLETRSIIQLQEAGEMPGVLERLLKDTQSRQILGERARAAVKKHQGATARTEKVLSDILCAQQFHKPI